MKNFSQFISEAKETRASEQAKKIGLVGDGHGDWYNSQGEFVAKTVNGQLKFFNKGERVGQRDIPPKPGAATSPQVTQTQSQQQAVKKTGVRQVGPKNQEELPAEDEFLTVVFGRFNPPTKEHKKLFSEAQRVSMGGEIRIYPSRIQDPKKNPLDVNKKISYLKKMFPDFAEDIVNNPDINTIFDVLIAANEDGYMNVNIVVGSDRQSEMQSLAAKHNGQLYEFTEIKVIPAGNFDAEKDAVGGVTSSMMRRTASENNYREFAKGVSKVLDETDIRKLFNDVRKGMGLNSKMKEHYEIWEIAPDLDFKNLRENYIQNNIFRLGDKVQNLNTGLIGEVMRRGTNYLICVTEDNVMFKSWISDLMEYNEVKMDSMYRLPKKPNTLVGTTGYLKYAIKQTPGSTLGRENLQSGGKSFLDFINKYKKKKVSA